jgi:hypothetical protein
MRQLLEDEERAVQERRLLPTSPRESRFPMIYSHP